MKNFLRVISGKLYLLIIPAVILFAGYIFRHESVSGYNEKDAELADLVQEQPEVPNRAERIMKTLSAAYPDRIGPAEFRTLDDDPAGDWAFFLNGSWFYYAEGRIIPEERRSWAAEYSPIRINQNYQMELPPWEDVAAAWETRSRSREEARANRQPRPDRQATVRPQYFFEALWNIADRDQAWEQQVEMEFLGFTLMIHSYLEQKMRLIEEIIIREAETNPAVRQWIDSLGTIAGWNWRNIRGSRNRSFHSYGIAIDILPRNLDGLATYWAWSPQWWDIPYAGRWHPPDEVIRTFESFGFIWGGKWVHNFDTMHFEYRPEIFILSDIPMTNF